MAAAAAAAHASGKDASAANSAGWVPQAGVSRVCWHKLGSRMPGFHQCFSTCLCVCLCVSFSLHRAAFDPLCRPSANGLFTQDASFWQTVHLGGDGWEECLADKAAAAKQAWADKVLVQDTHFHTIPGTGDKAAAQVGKHHSA